MHEKEVILIVDDNDTIRMLLNYAIKPMGYEVVEAVDGMDGLTKFEELDRLGTPPILILSDVAMPDMDGFEFIETVRSFEQTVPVLFLTAHCDNESREKGRKVGANGWIVKPFVVASIQEAIRDVLALG